MRRKMAVVLGFVFLSITVLACKDKQEDKIKVMEANVRSEIKKMAAKNGKNLEILELKIAHKSGNSYQGLLKTRENGNTIAYVVEITSDDNNTVIKLDDGNCQDCKGQEGGD